MADWASSAPEYDQHITPTPSTNKSSSKRKTSKGKKEPVAKRRSSWTRSWKLAPTDTKGAVFGIITPPADGKQEERMEEEGDDQLGSDIGFDNENDDEFLATVYGPVQSVAVKPSHKSLVRHDDSDSSSSDAASLNEDNDNAVPQLLAYAEGDIVQPVTKLSKLVDSKSDDSSSSSSSNSSDNSSSENESEDEMEDKYELKNEIVETENTNNEAVAVTDDSQPTAAVDVSPDDQLTNGPPNEPVVSSSQLTNDTPNEPIDTQLTNVPPNEPVVSSSQLTNDTPNEPIDTQVTSIPPDESIVSSSQVTNVSPNEPIDTQLTNVPPNEPVVSSESSQVTSGTPNEPVVSSSQLTGLAPTEPMDSLTPVPVVNQTTNVTIINEPTIITNINLISQHTNITYISTPPQAPSTPPQAPTLPQEPPTPPQASSTPPLAPPTPPQAPPTPPQAPSTPPLVRLPEEEVASIETDVNMSSDLPTAQFTPLITKDDVQVEPSHYDESSQDAIDVNYSTALECSRSSAVELVENDKESNEVRITIPDATENEAESCPPYSVLPPYESINTIPETVRQLPVTQSNDEVSNSPLNNTQNHSHAPGPGSSNNSNSPTGRENKVMDKRTVGVYQVFLKEYSKTLTVDAKKKKQKSVARSCFSCFNRSYKIDTKRISDMFVFKSTAPKRFVGEGGRLVGHERQFLAHSGRMVGEGGREVGQERQLLAHSGRFVGEGGTLVGEGGREELSEKEIYKRTMAEQSGSNLMPVMNDEEMEEKRAMGVKVIRNSLPETNLLMVPDMVSQIVKHFLVFGQLALTFAFFILSIVFFSLEQSDIKCKYTTCHTKINLYGVFEIILGLIGLLLTLFDTAKHIYDSNKYVENIVKKIRAAVCKNRKICTCCNEGIWKWFKEEYIKPLLRIAQFFIMDIIFFPALVLSIFQLITELTLSGEAEPLTWVLFMIGLLCEFINVYLVRVIYLICALISLLKVRFEIIWDDERKDKLKMLWEQMSKTMFLVLFIVYACSNMVVQIMVITSISHTFSYEFVNACNSTIHSHMIMTNDTSAPVTTTATLPTATTMVPSLPPNITNITNLTDILDMNNTTNMSTNLTTKMFDLKSTTNNIDLDITNMTKIELLYIICREGNLTTFDVQYKMSSNLVYMLVCGFFMPVMALVMFFVVHSYWTGKLPLTVISDMMNIVSQKGLSDIVTKDDRDDNMDEFSKLVGNYEKLSDKDREKNLKEFNELSNVMKNYKKSDFKMKMEVLEETDLANKIMLPFTNPLVVILSVSYIVLLIAFLGCSQPWFPQTWIVLKVIGLIFASIVNIYAGVVFVCWLSVVLMIIAAIVCACAIAALACFACLIGGGEGSSRRQY